MDLKRTERRTSAWLQTDEAERLAQLAAGLSKLETAPERPKGGESDIAHALRTRRRLRGALSRGR